MGALVLGAITGGSILSIITIFCKKCKCFVHRCADGRYDITFGLLDKPLPINDSVVQND